MGGEDIIQFQTCGSCSANDRDEACNINNEHDEAEVPGFMPNGERLGQSVGGTELEEGQLIYESENTGDVIGDSSCLHERLDRIEKSSGDILDYAAPQAEVGSFNDAEVEEGQIILDMSTAENACIKNVDYTGTVEENHMETATEFKEKCVYVLSENENGCVAENETSNSYPDIGGVSASSAKRKRATFDEQQPSVHVKYHGLSRQGKRKLEELLRQWSEWTAQNCSVSQDKNQESESGEEIYFPALDTGMGKTSMVSFWVENEIRKPQHLDFIAVEDDSAPLYDREFAMGLISADGSSNLERSLDLVEAPRCFNCGSYNHSLKECPKPRDNVAVNNSRKRLKLKRHQIAGPRDVGRYYQDSPGGKYEGLKPGVLDIETRRLLGLGELDPPPWLNRMREIGYPPGYLEPEDENLPSGIAIYAEGSCEEKEDGEILETVAELQKKMTVEFPGINARIPHNADEIIWAARPSHPDYHRTGDGAGSNHPSEFFSRGRYREHSSRGIKDEDQLGFERASKHSSRYGDDFGNIYRSSRDIASGPRSPQSGRSLGDRGRNDPSDSEDSLAYRFYSSYSYSSSRRFSEHSNDLDTSRGNHSDYLSRDRERYRHHSRR